MLRSYLSRKALPGYRKGTMGTQVEFYMTHNDERAFLEALGQNARFTIIHNTYSEPENREIDNLVPVGANRYDSNLALLNAEIDSKLMVDFVEKQSVYVVDLVESEVIQFNRCTPSNSWLRNGRLWFEARSRQPKTVEFVQWARWVVTWIRKSYSHGADGRYVGPDAKSKAAEGTLVLGPPIEGVSRDEIRKIIGDE